MNGIYQHYIIDMSSNNNFVQIPTMQGDGNGIRGFEIELIQNGVTYEINETDTIIAIAGTKPDTKQIFNPCTLTDEGYILVDITSQMSAVKGRGDYQIVLMSASNNSQIKSFPFHIITTPSTFDIEYLVSSDEFQLLTNTVGKISQDYTYIMESASKSAESAKESAEDASDSATAAKTSETNAKTSETNAKTSETNALASATTATTKATEASNSATAAKTSEDNAKISETNAKASETASKASEANAKISETNAKTSETNASNSVTLAESWAVGGTNTRTGEDTDNSKYYSEQANKSATSASTSATNASTSETNAGDSAIAAKSWAIGTTGTRTDEDIDNSKYYSEQSRLQATIATNEAINAKNEADRAMQYSSVVQPNFVIIDNRLYYKNGAGVAFITANNRLYWAISTS